MLPATVRLKVFALNAPMKMFHFYENEFTMFEFEKEKTRDVEIT